MASEEKDESQEHHGLSDKFKHPFPELREKLKGMPRFEPLVMHATVEDRVESPVYPISGTNRPTDPRKSAQTPTSMSSRRKPTT